MYSNVTYGKKGVFLVWIEATFLFPHINGLQSTLLSENDAQQHEALQIRFVAGNHWVASSSFGQQVTVFDSKYSGKLHPFRTAWPSAGSGQDVYVHL